MSDQHDSNNNSSIHRRRSSFAGQTLADLFGTNRPRTNTNNTADSPPNTVPNQGGSFPGPITQAAAQAHSRRMSLSTGGIPGASPSNTSPFGSFRGRGDSLSSANSGSIDESAIEDDAGQAAATPATPFARRMSFGARALRDVKAGPAGDKTSGTSSSSPGSGKETKAPTPTTMGRGEGFNWADNFRARAERSSISGASGSGLAAGVSPNNVHSRAKSAAVMEPPAREMPKANVPDHFQERILKGDFYMD